MANSAPALAPIRVNEQSSIQRDVASLETGGGVYQAVGTDHTSPRITQDRELAVYDFFPDRSRMVTIVNADSQNTGFDGIKVLLVPRELAQLAGTVRSPISAIEKQEYTLAAQRSEPERLAVFVFQDEVGRWLAFRGDYLWLG